MTLEKDPWAFTGLFEDVAGQDRSPVPIGGFYIRKGPVTISGELLTWDRVSASPTPYNLRTFALLRDFLGLANGTPQDFKRFAKSYGPLSGLCPTGGEREALADWRRCVEIVSGILKIANKIDRQELPDETDWAPLTIDLPPAGMPRTLRLQMEKQLLSSKIQEMVERWGVFPRVSFVGPTARLELGGGRLLSGIGAQLLCAVCKIDGFFFCADCGYSYRPDRKPPAGRNNFCEKCRRKGAKGKLAQRKYRNKLRQSLRKETAK